MNSNLKSSNPGSLTQLKVLRGAEQTRFLLQEGETYFVGASESCAIVATGRNVAQLHAMISYTDGGLQIQCCSPKSGIRVNGEDLETETQLDEGDEIWIGETVIVPERSLSQSVTTAQQDTNLTENLAEQAPIEDLPQDIDELAWDVGGLEFPKPDLSVVASNEELELLRSEVEFLQCEVAERDAKIEHLQKNGPTGSNQLQTASESDAERLVERLEELLVELNQSDERIRVLEDHLRTSEEANRAENEERQQLEKWIEEVESRIQLSLGEKEAELEQIGRRLKCELERRQSAEMQLSKLVAAERSASKNTERVDLERQKLEEQILQQQRLQESLAAENRELKQHCEKLKQDNSAAELSVLKQKMANVELTASRERAQIARERAELERLRYLLETQERSSEITDNDSRITAMRQHLREIHEEEKLMESERKQQSLGRRIANLLGRL